MDTADGKKTTGKKIKVVIKLRRISTSFLHTAKDNFFAEYLRGKFLAENAVV